MFLPQINTFRFPPMTEYILNQHNRSEEETGQNRIQTLSPDRLLLLSQVKRETNEFGFVNYPIQILIRGGDNENGTSKLRDRDVVK